MEMVKTGNSNDCSAVKGMVLQLKLFDISRNNAWMPQPWQIL